MLLQRKAHYNLLRFKFLAHPLEDKNIETWQVENLRDLSVHDLIDRLKGSGAALSLEDFEYKAKGFDSPEDMAYALLRGKSSLQADRVYLVVFELWRRFCQEKRTLSVFCDELDHQISTFYLENKRFSHEMQDALNYLEQILDENVDAGIDPHIAFQSIQTFSAHDLENFLYHYIHDTISAHNAAYATELLDAFSQYIIDFPWFDYLIARTEILEDPEIGYDHLEKIIATLQDFDLQEEILSFLATVGNHSLFYKLAKKMSLTLQTEADLHEFLAICVLHYHNLELKELEEKFSCLMQKRKSIPNIPLSETDPDRLELDRLLDQKVFLAVENG